MIRPREYLLRRPARHPIVSHPVAVCAAEVTAAGFGGARNTGRPECPAQSELEAACSHVGHCGWPQRSHDVFRYIRAGFAC